MFSILPLSFSDAILINEDLYTFHGFWKDMDVYVDDIYQIKNATGKEPEVQVIVGKSKLKYVHPDHIEQLDGYPYKQAGDIPGNLYLYFLRT